MRPRGIRNNNPGNIRHGDDWVGLAGKQTDTEFCVFARPKYGIRAIVRILRSYNKRGVKTVAQIVETWAPRTENPTDAYIANVSEWSGYQPDEEVALDISNGRLVPFVMALARQENGTEGFSEEVYLNGVKLGLR